MLRDEACRMGELSEEAIAGIVAHMNADHAESVCDYARHYGELDVVDAATLRTLDADAMTIVAFSGGAKHVLSVDFDHTLRDTVDARETLVAMARASARRG